jgi:predicted DsbA family dithiol-disulfide isomerase
VDPVRFTVWYDYLCPWCYNGSLRMRRLADEFPGQVELRWRSFLLRPLERGARDLERFRAYTHSWQRPAAEEDAGTFRVWEGDAGPPSHSVPPHRVAKAAAELGPEAFDAIHERLLQAYFAENRDVSERGTLAELWREAGLPQAGFARAWDEDLLSAVLAEHDDAIQAGVTGVPAVRLEGRDAVIVGAQPLELYRRWTRRALDGIA